MKKLILAMKLSPNQWCINLVVIFVLSLSGCQKNKPAPSGSRTDAPANSYSLSLEGWTRDSDTQQIKSGLLINSYYLSPDSCTESIKNANVYILKEYPQIGSDTLVIFDVCPQNSIDTNICETCRDIHVSIDSFHLKMVIVSGSFKESRYFNKRYSYLTGKTSLLVDK